MEQMYPLYLEVHWYWPIIGWPIIRVQQSADYRSITNFCTKSYVSLTFLPFEINNIFDRNSCIKKYIPANMYDLGVINMIFEADYANIIIIGNILIFGIITRFNFLWKSSLKRVKFVNFDCLQ